VHLVGQVVPPEALAHAVTEAVTRITAAPRDVLQRTKAKALTRAGYPPGTQGSPTLDL
jgi:hypothetical protein